MDDVNKNEYTNRELYFFLKEFKDDTKKDNDLMKVAVKKIEEQTIKTNGRVTALEGWRWFVLGGMGVVVTTGIPLIIYIYTNQI